MNIFDSATTLTVLAATISASAVVGGTSVPAHTAPGAIPTSAIISSLSSTVIAVEITALITPAPVSARTSIALAVSSATIVAALVVILLCHVIHPAVARGCGTTRDVQLLLGLGSSGVLTARSRGH